MKKKHIYFRKTLYKNKINSLNISNHYYSLFSDKNYILNSKQLECCRITTSRLAKKGIVYWNTNIYRNNLLDYNYTFNDLNFFFNNFDYTSFFKVLKKSMIYFFRKRLELLKKFNKKEKKKKIKKKQSNFFKSKKKQKDIFFKIINKKINFRINNYLNVPLVKRSNKSRMGKGKSRIHGYFKFIHINDPLIIIDKIDKKRKKKIKQQLNYKTNLNLFYNLKSS
jgi:ribosomal protein L16/L10AE